MTNNQKKRENKGKTSYFASWMFPVQGTVAFSLETGSMSGGVKLVLAIKNQCLDLNPDSLPALASRWNGVS
jgi:hypothetical protein